MSNLKRNLSASKPMFVSASTQDIKSKYDIQEKIDQGCSGQVYKAYLIPSSCDSSSTPDQSSVRAIKKIEKRIVKDPVKLRNEIEILQLADDPYIVRLFEYYEGPKDWWLVMEFCTGGNLVEYMKKRKTLNEKIASTLFKQLISGLKYLHDNNIVHRDLKPQNLVLSTPDNLNVKLIDFGLSKLCKHPSIKMRTKTGSPDYAAPEVRMNVEYTSSCDIWSCGCILYFLLSGKTPFHDSTQSKTLERIKSCRFNFDDPIWSGISDQAKDLISRLIVLDPNNRLSVDQILQHPWVLNLEINPELEIELDMNLIINYCDSAILRKCFLLCIAARCSDEDIRNLRDNFIALDIDNNGSLCFGEIENALKSLPCIQADVLEIMKGLDCNRNGKIDYTEFLAAGLDSSIYLNSEKLFDAFQVFDCNQDDMISADELRTLLEKEGNYLDLGMCEELIQQCDVNGDGVINFCEFVEMVEYNRLSRFEV